MVEEILRVEPQLFGSQVQHTSIARKAELWQRIVDRVNAVGQHPRNREDIRKRWNDLRGKVRSMVSRHNIAVQKTGGGPPPTPPEFTSWEQEVLTILHPQGLAGVAGGMDSETITKLSYPMQDPNDNTPAKRVQKCPSHHRNRPTLRIAALSTVNLMTSPDHRGPLGSRFPSGSHRPHQTRPPLPTPAQLPPSGPMPLSLEQLNQRCVRHYRAPRLTQHPNNNRDLGAVGAGTPARGQRPGETGQLGGLLCDGGGEERPREPTLQEALTTIMGAYHHSQETMATVLARFTEIQAQQEERYMGFREELRIIGTAMGTIVLALHRIEDALRDHGAPHRAPVTRPDQEQPTTSAGASGQEVPTPRQPPRTPPPAEEQPPRKRSLRPKKKTE
ncbi:hypothetical protein NDU88_010011 [Pleurodeles waltl]|uniref:Myb/SANT-like DNA-binding domain-containing protein n=2 Tax=Pleurodeles waltl TaxID=8319 RepID=A0AAV7PTP3_PLEWA|nr:hypothetical protein NDU88_010011 [Pleurodeles waltl]